MRPSIRFEVFKRDGFTCVYCGQRSPAAILEIDHVLAQARGGGDELDNLVTSCSECNLGKAARLLDQAAPVLDPARSERIAEHEQQIAEYSRWKAAQREREDTELASLADAFARIPAATFWVGTEQRWFWKPASVRTFLRRLGYYDVLEAIEIAGARADGWTGDPEPVAHDVWAYFCGVCWRRIKGEQQP